MQTATMAARGESEIEVVKSKPAGGTSCEFLKSGGQIFFMYRLFSAAQGGYNSMDDIDDPGFCARILAFLSVIMIIIFFPFSLVSSIKVD